LTACKDIFFFLFNDIFDHNSLPWLPQCGINCQRIMHQISLKPTQF
jgi:hypothetical protein